MNGFLYQSPRPSDYLFGSSLEKTVLQPDRDWTPYLPTFESQLFNFDTLACVSYSALNCLEILDKKFNRNRNFSDRFTAKMSGTTKQGNYFTHVADSIRRDGLIEEKKWPSVATSWEEYYQDPSQALKTQGQAFLDSWEPTYEWVSTDQDNLWDALQYAPIQVAWFYGRPNSTGVYPRYSEQGNHAVTLFRGEYGKSWSVFDHYSGAPVKTLAWDSQFWGALKYNLNPKQPKPMTNFEEGKLYQLVEGRGGAYLYSRGQLLTGEEGKVLFAWTIMNNGKVEGKIGRLLLADLQGVQVYDMSRRPI